jgi:threonine/homoserine/homoserine lactone efflux protein
LNIVALLIPHYRFELACSSPPWNWKRKGASLFFTAIASVGWRDAAAVLHVIGTAERFGKGLARKPVSNPKIGRILTPSAIVPQLWRPAHPRPIQPIRTSELLIALAVIALIAMLMTAGFMLGRMQRRRAARRYLRQMKRQVDNRKPRGQRPKLRLITSKRR